MVSESFTLVIAKGLTKVGEGGGVAGEDIVVHRVPLADIAGFIEAKRAEGMAMDVKLLLLLGPMLLGADAADRLECRLFEILGIGADAQRLRRRRHHPHLQPLLRRHRPAPPPGVGKRKRIWPRVSPEPAQPVSGSARLASPGSNSSSHWPARARPDCIAFLAIW